MREVGLADNANRPKIEFVASSGVRRPDRNRLFTGQVEDASTKKHTLDYTQRMRRRGNGPRTITILPFRTS
jgi:hypothetical protein